MSIKFNDGTMAIFADYSMGYVWNDPTLLGLVGNFGYWNTEKNMLSFLKKIDPKIMEPMEFDYQGLLASPDVTLWVVKGVHQVGNGLFATPHITLGYRGYLWHVNCLNDRKHGFTAYSVTKGSQQTDEDADGFTIVKKKGK